MIWLVLIIPMLVPILSFFYYGKNREPLEYFIHFIVTIIVTCGVYYAGKYYPAMDVEIYNGCVTDKAQVYNPRTEYYDCHCRTEYSGTGKNRTSRRVCDTCTRIIPEWDWRVYTNIGDINISRVDRAGRIEPKRWSKVVIGESVALEHSYINQIKGVKDSIFHYDPSLIEQYEKKIPEYPRVYDYYRFNRIINQTSVDTSKWNDYINDRLKTLGKEKQLNIIVVLTNDDYNFYEALKVIWLGGKKNDVVMVIGADNNKVKWFGSTSLADGYKNQELHARLRMNSHDKVIDDNFIKEQVDIIEKEFIRTPMEEFDYLTKESEPPTWIMFLAVVLGTLVSVGVTIGIERFKR